MKPKGFLVGAGIAGFLGVGLGAFGAHGLANVLGPESRQVFETGVQYHLIHALFLLVIGLIRHDGKALKFSYFAAAVGILLFSGSLYLLAVTGIKTLGFITPFGGLAFLAAWAALLPAAWAARNKGK